MDHVQTPGACPHSSILLPNGPDMLGLEAELGLSELIMVYNALAGEMLRPLDLYSRPHVKRTGCYVFLWRWMALFMAIHPWVKACCFSLYISHSARVSLLAAYVLSLAAFTSIVYLPVALHWSAQEECYATWLGAV